MKSASKSIKITQNAGKSTKKIQSTSESKIKEQSSNQDLCKNDSQNTRPLFLSLVVIEGLCRGYLSHFFDQIIVFTLLLKKVYVLKGFSIVNWFVSQIFSAAILSVLRIKVLSSIEKVKRAYIIGVIIIISTQILLSIFAIYLNQYKLNARIIFLCSNNVYFYLFYLGIKIIQNCAEFVNNTLIGRIIDFLILNIKKEDDKGNLETDIHKINEKELQLLSIRERYSTTSKVITGVLLLFFRPGYFYYVLKNQNIHACICKRLVTVFTIQCASVFLIYKVSNFKKDPYTDKKPSLGIFTIFIKTIKILYYGFLDLGSVRTSDSLKIDRIRLVILVILSYGHTLFANILLDKLKTLYLTNNATLNGKDIYYSCSYESIIQIIIIGLLIVILNKLESIWVKYYNRENYHYLIVRLYIMGAVFWGILQCTSLFELGFLILAYNILNGSTRIINLKILLKKHTTLTTIDVLMIYSDLFDAGVLLTSLILEYIGFPLYGYLIFSAVCITVYSIVLNMFHYYNKQSPPLDVLQLIQSH